LNGPKTLSSNSSSTIPLAIHPVAPQNKSHKSQHLSDWFAVRTCTALRKKHVQIAFVSHFVHLCRLPATKISAVILVSHSTGEHGVIRY
jgi:hypothetical protein